MINSSQQSTDQPLLRAKGILRLIAVGVLLLALGLFTLVMVNGYLKVDEVSLPNLVGMDIDDAYRELRELDLEVASYPENLPGAAVNSVTSQSPAPGIVVRKGRSVSIGVHTPPEDIRVPNLVGVLQEQALSMLADVNLVAGEINYVYSEQEEGRVIGQSPEAGTMLSTGSSVSVVVSRGAEARDVVLPNLRGMGLDEARDRLRALGVRRVEAVPSRLSFREDNVVNAQTPSAGQIVPVSALVTLYYSLSSREVVKIPTVYGQSLQRAQLILRAAGLDIAWVTYVQDAEKPAGVVEVQPSDYTLPGTPLRVTVNGSETGANVLLPLELLPDDPSLTSPVNIDGERFPGDRQQTSDPDPITQPPNRSGARSIPISFNPADFGFLQGRENVFRLVIVDDRGERVAIERRLEVGMSVNTTVLVYGDAELRTYINGNIFQAWNP